MTPILQRSTSKECPEIDNGTQRACCITYGAIKLGVPHTECFLSPQNISLVDIPKSDIFKFIPLHNNKFPGLMLSHKRGTLGGLFHVCGDSLSHQAIGKCRTGIMALKVCLELAEDHRNSKLVIILLRRYIAREPCICCLFLRSNHKTSKFPYV